MCDYRFKLKTATDNLGGEGLNEWGGEGLNEWKYFGNQCGLSH